jgi:hypothetical protein
MLNLIATICIAYCALTYLTSLRMSRLLSSLHDSSIIDLIHHNQTTRNSLGFIYFSPCFSFTKQKFAIIVAVTEESVREEHFLHDLCLLGAVTAEITQILTRAGFTLRKYSWTPLKLQTGLVMWWSEITANYTQHEITHLAYTCFAWTWYIIWLRHLMIVLLYSVCFDTH